MARHQSIIQALVLSSALVGLSGCSDVDRVGTKIDMAGTRLDEPHLHEYEGQVQSVRAIGGMTALQFADGNFYDVSEAPSSLVPGDIVRIYKTPDGYEARLWRPAAATSEIQNPS